MIKIRRSDERGKADHGWLKTSYTFSFADYYDPRNMGYRSLRVINDDYVEGGQGFGAHAHRDMEILTYVLEGSLEHKDSMGNHGVLPPGEIQRMSAGTGVRHSEFNHSKDEWLHLLQIWILPERNGIAPSYEQKPIAEGRDGKLKLIAAPNGNGNGTVKIHQDARVYASVLKDGETVAHSLEAGRGVWLQIARGEVTVNGQTLKTGDGAAIEDEKNVDIASRGESEFLLFDLA